MDSKSNEIDIDTAQMIELFQKELEELKKQKLEQQDLIVMNLGDNEVQSKYESINSSSNSESLLTSEQELSGKAIQLPETFESFQEESPAAKGFQTPSPKGIKKQIFEDYKESYKVFELNSSPPDPFTLGNDFEKKPSREDVALNEMEISEEESKYFIRNKDTGEVFDIRMQETVMSLYENKGKKKISIPTKAERRAWQDFWKERKQEMFDLWDACEIGDVEKLCELLNKSQATLALNINTKGLDDFTALHLAALEGHSEIVKKLIEHDANVECVSSMGRNPLHIACLRGVLEVVKILVEAKADINAQDRDFNTPLHLAVEYGHNEILKYLLERGADMNIKNYQGMTAKDMCTSLATRKVFQDFGAYGDAEDSSSNYGRTLFADKVLLTSRKDHVEKLLHLTNKSHKEAKIIEKIEKQENQETRDTTPRKETGPKTEKKPDQTPVKKDSAELERKNTTGKKEEDNKKVAKKDEKKEELSAFKSKISRIFIFDYLTNAKERNSNPDPAEEKIGPQSFNYIRMLGKGSFGEVYLAEKKSNKKLYAIKVLEKDRIFNQNLVRYAKTERNVLSIMNHPFIVKLNFAFQTDKKLFLVMDYCAGGDMGKMLQKKRKVSEDVARIYISELLLALETLHKNLIIFRDLKPDNVVLDEEGHALLTDFGLSKQGVENNLSKSFCGSVAYLAPEMLNRAGHGRTVDWYLLGVLLYELIVGIPPYYHSNRDQLFENIKKGPLMLPKTISEDAKDLIKKLLSRDPQKRLGAKRDAEEIKEHPWFISINWSLVYERKLKPPAIPPKDSNFLNDYITVAFEKDSKGKKELQIKDWSFICRDGEDLPDKK